MQINHIKFENDVLVVSIDNTTYRHNLADVSQKLLNANVEVRNDYKISTSGYGIHWYQLDEDISIKGLLKIN